VIAHVAGAPIEETLLPLLGIGIGGIGTGLVVVRAWWSTRRGEGPLPAVPAVAADRASVTAVVDAAAAEKTSSA
jgi:hypothetical protein